MIETFKIIHGYYDHETVCSLFKLYESAGTRGHPFKLHKKTVLTNQHAHFFFTNSNRVINNWNSLPPSTVLDNIGFLEITGKDNLTVFSYSGRVKSPEWRRHRRRADLRHFEVFRHGPIIIYTRLPAGGTYYQICTFPTFFAFCLRVSVILPTCSLYPNKSVATLRYTRRHGPIYSSMPVGTYRVQSLGFPKIVYYNC